jgi:hypothetical protein
LSTSEEEEVEGMAKAERERREKVNRDENRILFKEELMR